MNSLRLFARRLPLVVSLLPRPVNTPIKLNSTTALLRPVTTITGVPMATTGKVSADILLDQIRNRRTYYSLGKDVPISKDRIQEIVKEALTHVPSSFNSQSNRVVVLFDGEHDKFWGITEEVLRAIVPEANWEHTGQRLAMFKGAAGTVSLSLSVPPLSGVEMAHTHTHTHTNTCRCCVNE